MALQQMAWDRLSPEDIQKRLKTDFLDGLSRDAVKNLQHIHGKNILTEIKEIGLVGKIVRQFKSPLVFILLGAGVVTLFLSEFVNATVIFIALLINVVVGTIQEERASRAFEKLNKSQERHATVIRDGTKTVILSEDLVPGDVVVITSGSYVPADMRIVSARDLSINEATLTGEWVAVTKETGEMPKNIPLAEKRNMAWMGTLVSAGYGTGVVVETGETTQVGSIAKELGSIDERMTPLRESIRTIARFLTYVIAAAILVILVLGLLRGEPLGSILLIAIALAVATIPEGLPMAVTVVLALGMESILAHGGLVRNLLAAETLGTTTVILTDKTGTLTEARMKLSDLYTLESLKGSGRDLGVEDERELLRAGVLASDAFIEESSESVEKEKGLLVVHGRPLEKAILLSGLDAGLSRADLSDEYKQLDYLQFESIRRFGVVLTLSPKSKKHILYLKGAPEMLLEHAQFVYQKGKAVPLTRTMREHFEAVQIKESRKGKRFIGVSYKLVDDETIILKKDGSEDGEFLEKTVFLGFMSFEDPIREDVKEAIEKVQGAGARVIMVTGDNPETARYVASEVGIAKAGERVRLGSDIENWDDERLYDELMKTSVFARTLPSHKLRISRVLQNSGEIVAMTGDGINDAPALRSANIGVAVGSGTEVAKEASDLILLNNSFSIIVAAIEEGRKIIDNLKKIIAYLLSTSFSEIFLIGAALIVGAPLPLLPAQILWANIIEEGLMSFAFAFEKKEPGLMKRNPRSSMAKNIMTAELKGLIFIVSAVTGVFLIALYFILLRTDMVIEEIRTIMFVALSLDAIFFTFSIKDLHTPVWKIDLFSNKYLLVALVLNLILLVAAVTLSPLQFLLTLVPLSLGAVAILFTLGLLNLLTIEVVKHFLFGRRKA